MDHRRFGFDTLTAYLGNRRSRRSVIAAVAGALTMATTHQRGSAHNTALAHVQSSVGSDVVEQYYLAVATYQYEHAYELFGAELQADQPFDDYVAGYADTAYVEVSIGDTRPSGDHEDVQVTITAWHNDGSIHQFSGSYAVGKEHGRDRIVAASIWEDAPPTDVPPLCQVEDVHPSFGQWDAGAGNRYGTLLVTNEGADVCLAAGVPHLQVYDANEALVIESRTEQTEPITAVPLHRGDQAATSFRWANWCEDEPAYPLTLNVALPGDTDRITLAMETTDGPVQMPPCMGEGEPASFGVKAFQPADETG